MESFGGSEFGGYADTPKIVKGAKVCAVCGMPLERKLTVQGVEISVGVMCRCQQAEHEKRVARYEADEKRIRIERLKATSLMTGDYANASFDRYITREGNQRALTACKRYMERFTEYKRDGVGLMLFGPVGTGKSYTAACLANGLMERERTVVMTSLVMILEKPQWYDEGKAGVYVEPDLLIIDDFGVERQTDYALERTYGVIDARVRSGKPLVITTNLSVQEMIDETDIKKVRIYDRIIEACTPISITGSSFRRAMAIQRQKRLMEELTSDCG